MLWYEKEKDIQHTFSTNMCRSPVFRYIQTLEDKYETSIQSDFECVGNTPLVRLNHVTKGLKCTVYAKVNFNPLAP